MFTSCLLTADLAALAGSIAHELDGTDCDSKPCLSGTPAEVAIVVPESGDTQRAATVVRPQHAATEASFADSLRQGHELGPTGGNVLAVRWSV